MGRSSRLAADRAGAMGASPTTGLALAVLAASGLAGGLTGCGGDPSSGEARAASPLIYGADDRREFYELDSEPLQARIAGAMVALMPRACVRKTPSGVHLDAPNAAERYDLCPGERFADQPAAAFCSGVLVDWDLVLTAGHCARVVAPGEYAVVFDYHYGAPGVLTLDADVRNVVGIVDEALDGPGVEPRRDHAWLRLDRPASSPHRPAPLARLPLAEGDPLTVVSTGGGLPMKADAGARVRGARAAADYFVADSDTSHGSSGGAAFDDRFVLRGILARGADDLVGTPEGCNVMARRPSDQAAEEFTYAGAALEALCRAKPDASSLCRPACGEPCEAVPAAPPPACAYAPRAAGPPGVPALLLLAALASTMVRVASRAYSRLDPGPWSQPRQLSPGSLPSVTFSIPGTQARQSSGQA
jgi:hypothetical protein